MLKKQNRLAKTKDIKATIKSGRVFLNPNLNLKFLIKPNQPPRFTVVVGTKVFKNATQRNRMKRVFREEIRKNISQTVSGDYMVFIKPIAAKKPEKEVLESFKKLLRQERFLKT
jgi:ribonuclease P protein component